MSNEPHVQYPSFQFPTAKSHDDPATALLEEWLGKPRYPQELRADEGRPIEAETLARAYGKKSTHLASILHKNFVNAEGWWLAFAPLQRQPGLIQHWDVVTLDRGVMEPAPEDTAPHFVTYRSEEHEEVLTRYNNGAEFHHDALMRPDFGPKDMNIKMSIIVSDGYITTKLIVQLAIINAPLHYQNTNLDRGRSYASAQDALRDEIEMTGIFSKDEKAIYRLKGYMDELTKDASVTFDMAVVTKGTLNFLALAGDFETEAYRRGEKKIEERLTLGARSMRGAIPGITFYEDEIWNLQNMSPDNLNLFQRVMMSGGYSVLRGSDFGKYLDTFPAVLKYSLKVADMRSDDYRIWDINDAIASNQRWDDDGNLLSHHQGLIDNLAGEIQRSGVRLWNGLVDPYIWKSGSHLSLSGHNPLTSGEGYHVVEHWGDQDTYYRSIDQDIDHGRMFSKNVRRELTTMDMDNILELEKLRDQLHEVDAIDESIEAFFVAVTANAENRNGPDFAAHNAFLLKANPQGSVQIPGVEHAPHQYHAALGLTEQASDMQKRGALYVENAEGQRLYVWKLVPDPDTRITINGNDRQFRARLDSNVLRVGLNIPEDPIVLDTEIRNLIQAPDLAGQTVAYVLATFEAFGEVARDGSAPLWNRRLEANSKYRSKEQQVLDLAGAGDIAAVDVANNVTQGFLAPRLVSAPMIPYGMGNVTGLATLAQMYNNGDCRGWDETMCAQAYAGVRSLRRYMDIVQRVYPHAILFDANYVPNFMATGDSKVDRVNSVLASLWDHIKYPIWARVPFKTTEFRGAEWMVELELQDMTGVNLNLATDFDHEDHAENNVEIRTLLGYMGFRLSGERVGGYRAHLGDEEASVSVPELAKVLRTLLTSRHITPSLLNTLKANAQGEGEISDAQTLFRVYSDENEDNRSHLGRTYAQTRNLEMRDQKDRSSFAWFFQDEIVPTHRAQEGADRTRAISLFNGILGLTYGAYVGDNNTYYVSRGMIETFKNFDDVERSSRKQARREKSALSDLERSLPDAPNQILSKTLWINTRLTLSETSWHAVGEAVSSEQTSSLAALGREMKRPIRPTNPLNPNEPLAAGVINWEPDVIVRDMDNIRSYLLQLKHARADVPARGIDSTIFASAHFARADTRNVRRRIATAEEMRDGFSALDDQPQWMPGTMREDAAGPLYEMETFTDRTGSPLDNLSRVVQKDFLVTRLAAVAQDNTDFIARMGSTLLELTRVHRNSLLVWLKEGLPIPSACQMLAQPFMRVRADSMLWAKGGSDTAQTGYNYEDAVLQFNGVNKVWIVHFTIWLNCAVLDVTKFLLQPDVRYAGYESGIDNTVFQEPDAFNPEDIDFSQGSGFVFDCGSRFAREDAIAQANPLSLYGKYDPRVLPHKFQNRDGIMNSDRPHFPSFLYYNYVWGLTDLNRKAQLPDGTFHGLRESTHIPGLLYPRKNLFWEETTKDWTKVERGDGILGDFDPPMKAVLNGTVQRLKIKY